MKTLPVIFPGPVTLIEEVLVRPLAPVDQYRAIVGGAKRQRATGHIDLTAAANAAVGRIPAFTRKLLAFGDHRRAN